VNLLEPAVSVAIVFVICPRFKFIFKTHFMLSMFSV